MLRDLDVYVFIRTCVMLLVSFPHAKYSIVTGYEPCVTPLHHEFTVTADGFGNICAG